MVHMSIRQIRIDIVRIDKKPNDLFEAFRGLEKKMSDLTAAIRRELGIPMTPEKEQQ